MSKHEFIEASVEAEPLNWWRQFSPQDLGPRDAATRLTIQWPSGAAQEFSAIRAGGYECEEGQPLKQLNGY